MAHGIPSKFATQQLLIYPPHQRIAATLLWERVDCTVHIVVTLATKVIITVAQNNKDIQLVHTGALTRDIDMANLSVCPSVTFRY